MDYEIRPTDGKHTVILPVGQEVEFKLKKDHMSNRIQSPSAYLGIVIAPRRLRQQSQDIK
jgi:hypothetical protein